MTQSPDNSGGQPAADRPPGDQDQGASAPPPPESWHFPPEPVPPPVPQAQQPYGTPASPYGSPPQYGAPQYGTPPPYGSSPPYGTPPQYGAPPSAGPPQYGMPPQAGQPPYGAPPQYGTPPQYGAPPQGSAPPQYGAPPQQGAPYGTVPPYGTSPHYGTPPQPYGPAYPAYGAGAARPREPDLAEWWRRLLGRLIDALIVAVVLTPIAIPLLSRPFHRFKSVINRYPNLNSPAAKSALTHADGKLFGAMWILLLTSAVLWFVYDSVQHAKWGQTVGKRVLSTRVVSAYDRSPVSGAAAAKRAAVYALIPVIPLVGSVFALLNELWLTWDRRKQCLHDKAARTIVIKTNVPPAGNWQQGSPW